jgi:hypothetical protein
LLNHIEVSAMTRITDLRVFDLRFPTSQSLDGSDAMNPDPDYSAAYVILDTDAHGLSGHGLTFTIGRGNDICCMAIEAMRHLLQRSVDSLSGILAAEFETGGALAVSFYVNRKTPIVAFGSAFREDLHSAISHAAAESTMLRTSLALGGRLTPRHKRLVDDGYAAEMLEYLETRWVEKSSAKPVRIDIPDVWYAFIVRGCHLSVCRVSSSNALDISLDASTHRSPFL